MFRIEILPAEYGDALWIEYGPKKTPRRILIDCGTPGVYKAALEARIKALPESQRSFELFVVSHVDADHIGGALKLLRNRAKLGVEFKEIWFNGYQHLMPADAGTRGAKQGEQLSTAIVKQRLQWNGKFGGGPVVVPAEGKLPAPSVEGMKLTLLSPYAEQLAALQPVWKKAVEKAGLVPGKPIEEEEAEPLGADDLRRGLDVDDLAASPFKQDTAEANGSSIAFVAEYEGTRVLFGADAFAPVLVRSLGRVNGGAAVKLDAFKVSHHGSGHNTSRELLEAVRCRHYMISTNGKRFRHPSLEGIARIVAFGGGTVHFNYRTEFNDMWDSKTLKKKHGYATQYSKSEGIAISLA